MLEGTESIGAIDFGADPDETFELRDSLLARIARGADVTLIFFARIYSRPVDQSATNFDEFGEIGSLAIGEESNELAGAGLPEPLLLSDAEWCGRPDDFGAADLEADPRLIIAGNLQQRIPYFPEEDRRAVAVTGTLVASNADGFFSKWQHGRSVVGETVQLFIGEARGYSHDWIHYSTARIQSFSVDRDEATFTLETLEFLLDVEALTETFGGTGGSAGDAHLAGRRIPLAIGDLSNFANVEPVLESKADNIDRWSAGRIHDIVVIRDSGVPLPWDGVDHADYLSLKNAVVPAGYFTKACAIGRSKRGSVAVGRITGDLYGSTLFTGFSSASGPVLDFVVLGLGGVPAAYWNASSIGVLPDAPIGLYLDGSSPVQVKDIVDRILRPFNGHLITQSDGRLAVGLAAPKAVGGYDFEIEAGDFYALDDREFEELPRFEQQVTYAHNYTPMSADELVSPVDNPAVTPDAYTALQREYEIATDSDTRVKQQFKDALGRKDLSPIESLLRYAEGARAAAAMILSLLKRSNMKPAGEIGMRGILSANGLTAQVTAPELDFDRGRPGLVVEKNLNAEDRSFEIVMIAERTNAA